MKKIKVLIVAGVMDVGGIENQLMHLLRNADKDKFQIDYTSTIDAPFYKDEIEKLGGKVVKLEPQNRIHIFRYCRSLYKVIKEGHYDIVHSHELYHSGLVITVARLAGVRHRFVHAHSSNQIYSKNLIRKFYRWAMRRMILENGTQYFACSSWAAEFLYGENILDNQKYHLIVNSVDTRDYLQTEIREAVADEFRSDWKNVLQVGRFADEKNFVFTVQLAKECKKRNNNIRFICVGNNGNEYEAQIRKAIAENQLEEYMILKGIRKDVAQIMKCSDAFILPSKYEGMPLTLIEAQASGLPCVAADTFSHEVDFGIDSIKWMKLDGNVSKWVDEVEKSAEKGKSDLNEVKAAIKKYGFDSRDFAANVSAYYRKAVEGTTK